MNEEVLKLARQFQTKIEWLDPQTDRDTLIWAHEFLSGLIGELETAIASPEGSASKLLSEADPSYDTKLAEQSTHMAFRRLSDEPDSLEQIERELEGGDLEGEAGVPARRKPGPKGLTGGAMLPLPGTDFKM